MRKFCGDKLLITSIRLILLICSAALIKVLPHSGKGCSGLDKLPRWGMLGMWVMVVELGSGKIGGLAILVWLSSFGLYIYWLMKKANQLRMPGMEIP